MKNGRYWILLFLLMLPQLLYQSIMLLHQTAWHHYVHEVQLSYSGREEFTTFIFHQKDLRLLHWHKPKEFEWHGQMYDVKEQYTRGDSVHLLVWADKHETVVNGALRYLNNLKDNAPGAGHALLSHLLAAAYPYFIASPIASVPGCHFSIFQILHRNALHMPHVYIGIVPPPPRSC